MLPRIHRSVRKKALCVEVKKSPELNPNSFAIPTWKMNTSTNPATSGVAQVKKDKIDDDKPHPQSGADHGSSGQGSPDQASARCVEFLSDLMSRSSETAIRHGGRTFALEPGCACGVIMVPESLSDR